MSKTIAIAGMGWLGLSLAQRLHLLGYKIKGSVTSLAKAETLQKNGFEVYPIEISEIGIKGPIKTFLKEVDYLVLLIPPGLRRNTGADYVLKMTHLLEQIELSSVKKVILISSTSVYADEQGQVTEKIEPQPSSQSGKQLLQVEQLYSNKPTIQATIVRFGGLYGGSRQPVRYLAGRKDLNGGKAPVNLIHRNDCIGILVEIIKQDKLGFIFNAVSPKHPKKKTYYYNKAVELKLDPPTFSEENEEEIYKRIDSVNIIEQLGYTFKESLE
ncbi:MAG: nucleoside-diphosphate-sugar epimerase [Flavobacteriaceae bacterium]|uniref:NAD-dependent epimerase/dehydratase family protein n=1 Tax=Candidatus Marifrigoribacter sp. Uisw_064 TaxID=3230970 RepID=UPI003AECEBAF